MMNRWLTGTIVIAVLACTSILLWSTMLEAPESDPPAAALATQTWQIQPLQDPSRLAGPGGSNLDQLLPEQIHRLSPQPAAPEIDESIHLVLPEDTGLGLIVAGSFVHANGDVSIHARTQGEGLEQATMTWGHSGVFGRITTEDGVFLVHSDATGTWLLDLTDERLSVDDFSNDTLGTPPGPMRTSADGDHAHPALAGAESVTESDGDLDQIDVMFIYPPEMLERYPDDLIETRLNHLVAIANQAMVDSRVPIVVRLVHHRLVTYDQEQNNSAALQDLNRAMAGEPVAGFGGVRDERFQKGADIVALTWPHNIETRGSCGIARFPRTDDRGNPDPSSGIHITNDGASNWSVCSDAVFTHELGHNLGAEHQRGAASTNDPDAFNYGFVREGRFHTVMGTFPTGHVHRYWRLNVFSNPDIQCGGVSCGSMAHGRGANNARQITELAPVISNYAATRIDGMADRPDPSEPDSDGDGVSDWEDPYPFDPFDSEQPPITSPPLVFSDRQLRQPRADTDWELLVVSSGSDQVLSYHLDGSFRSVVAAPEAADAGPILTEHSDIDVDQRGMLYLLASGDVRRFDRLSGRLIDVFLSSQMPEPRELQSSFPRALGWITDDQLVVLGNDAIERYDTDGNQLNARFNSDEPTDNPGSWSRVLDLPLRAFAYRDHHLYVAEAAQNRIMIFNARNGWRSGDIGGMQQADLIDPRDMAFGPDGLLYVANGRANNVLRFHVGTRRLVDKFVPAGAGGLDFARALAFGPDGDLYVASRNNHSILRFDGSTGAFVEATIAPGHGGLQSPENLQFAPVLDQIHAGHSGHYFVPERPGEGWLLEVLDDEQAVLSWFTYPPEDHQDGRQAWVLGVGEIDGNRIIFDDATSTRLADPAAGFEPDNLELIDWGRMVFVFSNCAHGTMHYDSSAFAQSGQLDFIRLANITGVPCGSVPLSPSASAPGISGQWYDPARNGQGWFFQEVQPGRVFTAWFTYDEAGEQAWIVGEGTIDGRVLEFTNLVMTRGTHFGDAFDPDEIDQIDWGSMTVNFTDCYHAEIDYHSDLPAFGSGFMQVTRLTELQDLDCALGD